MRKQGKLVRDKIPERIEAKGEACTWHTAASDAEFGKMLGLKLLEEVGEFMSARSCEEFADVLEVVETIVVFHGFSRSVLLHGYASAGTFSVDEFEDKDLEYDLLMKLDDLAAVFLACPDEARLTTLLARVWEVAAFQGIDLDQAEEARSSKRATHGAFDERIILDES